MKERKANLFIVGAMKAGTTSFNELLLSIPEVYFSPIKEPNYLIKNLPESIFKPKPYFSLEKYFSEKFPEPLHISRITDQSDYSKLYSLAKEETYLAEGSTAYFHAEESPEMIFQYNPNAKVIILVRDGLNRAFSHYKMNVGLGKTKDSFENLLAKDIEGYENATVDPWSYLGMSLYAENISRYKKVFGKNVLVIEFENLISNQSEVLQKLFDFLELPRRQLILPNSNESANLRFKKLIYFIYQTGIKDFFSFILPIKLRHAVFNMMKKKTKEEMQLSSEVKNKAMKIFQQDKNKIR